MESLTNPWPSSWTPPDQAQRPRLRSSTAPNATHPAPLTVAHPIAAASVPPSIHNPDVFFMQPPLPPASRAPSPISPPLPDSRIPPRLPYPQDYIAPNLRRVRTAPPPVPPHPYSYATEPHIPPVPPKVPVDSAPKPPPRPRPASISHIPPAPPVDERVEDPTPLPQEDDAELAELAAVLALSQAEKLRQEKLREKMQSQEEADLARALEASMAASSWSNSYSTAYGDSQAYTTAAGPSTQTPSSPSAEINYMDDEAFARMLASQEDAGETPTASTFSENKATFAQSAKRVGTTDDVDVDVSQTSPAPETTDLPVYSPRRAPVALAADEELARQLVVEEEVLARESKDKPPQEPPDLPSYSGTARSISPVEIAESPAESPRNKLAMSWAAPENALDSPRPASVDATNFRSPSGLLYPPESIRPLSSVSLRSEDGDGHAPVSANQFIDADILRGVSIGFVSPPLLPELVPMQAQMPNIISLPYGRCPPLHLQAPNWRHLLKLMARLSGTRIEPTVEAMAVTRSAQMHLRTVVQFVRPHHASSDWRTVLWFTIDHPVPTSMPGARKYTNGDVDMLPWSYTLSSLPALLRDGADTMMSKTYTIPSSDSVPFPALPISFPNMAMYLQAALEESRRYTNDSSSGMRKLAKMVETCYPASVEGADAESERSRMGVLFKKVIRRGGRKDKSKKGKGGNEDTYELVTPFVLDEYGP